LGDFVPSGKSYRFKCGLDGSHRAHAIQLTNATPSRHLIDFASNRFATDPANQRYVACTSCNCIHSRRLDAQPCRASLVGGRPNVGHARTSSSWTLANPPRSDCRREPACLARPLILAAEGAAGAHATGLFSSPSRSAHCRDKGKPRPRPTAYVRAGRGEPAHLRGCAPTLTFPVIPVSGEDDEEKQFYS